MAGTHVVFPEYFRDFFWVVDELRTARPQRGANARNDISGIAMKYIPHCFYGVADDIVDAAAPTGMNICSHLPDRIIHQHRLAVRYLDGQEFARDVRDQRIPSIRKGQLPCHFSFIIFLKNNNILSMNLVKINDIFSVNGPGNLLPVYFNMDIIIADSITNVEASKRAGAFPMLSSKNAMPDIGEFR